jgi:8-oxo-dGTP diphosphatase
MIKTTLVIVIDETSQQILLGRKKIGFGRGKFTCIGGKIEPDEHPQDCVQREFREESSLSLPTESFELIGFIAFKFPFHEGWGFDNYVFRVTDLNGGIPQESNEIQPQWFPIDHLPWDKMWADNRHWIELAARGEKFSAEFTYGEDGESLTEYQVKLVEEIQVW